MTLFGTPLDGQQIASLVAMLALLVFYVFVLRREQGYARWFKSWEAARKARKDAQSASENSPPDEKRGPWG